LLDVTDSLRSETLALEIVRLAEKGLDLQSAIDAGNPLAVSLYNQNRYGEAEALCQRILVLGEDFRTLTSLARIELRLGRGGFSEHIERAVALLPSERLDLPSGFLRECAFTVGTRADILQARGQLDEALRIREQEELPVYEKLGDVRSLLVGRTKLAIFFIRKVLKATPSA
jgi:tetratricopeptide (TPR) repeat protein